MLFLGLTVMLSVMFFIVLSLFIFNNPLYFTMSLLSISIITLSLLAMNSYVNSITALMLVIVYVGAMIVLIGYICAVSPNLFLEPDYSHMYLLLAGFFLFHFQNEIDSCNFAVTNFTLVDFFYSFQGLFLFSSLVFMLFITLLIVTSQYIVPRGPFRSVNV